MKNGFFVFLFSLCNQLGYTQYNGADSLQMQHLVMGIQQDGGSFYNAEGYAVFLVQHDYGYNEKGFKKLKKKYRLDDFAEELPHPSLPDCRVFVTTKQRATNVIESGVYYVFPDGQAMRVVGLQTTMQRDKSYETWCVGMTIKQQFPASVYTPMVIDSFSFAGRVLVLGRMCIWKNIRNVQCADYGQMNWSEFRTMQRAQEMVHNQYQLTNEKAMGVVLKSDTIDVVFEGQRVRALKVLYKIKLPSAITGGSNLLVIYYIAAEVRQRYVGCVLSQYTSLIEGDELAPLLGEVMEVSSN